VSFRFAAVVHPSVGVFVGFVGGFVAAAALGVGWWRLFSLLLYVFLYVVLTNLLVFCVGVYALRGGQVGRA
jgi:cation transporter-like permease